MDPKEKAEAKIQVYRQSLEGVRNNAPLGSLMHLHRPRTNNLQKNAELILGEARRLASLAHGRLWICIVDNQLILCDRGRRNELARVHPKMVITEVRPVYEG